MTAFAPTAAERETLAAEIETRLDEVGSACGPTEYVRIGLHRTQEWPLVLSALRDRPAPIPGEPTEEDVARVIGEAYPRAGRRSETDGNLETQPLSERVCFDLARAVAALYRPCLDRLRAERDEFERQIEALEAKTASLSPHGTCACSYDRPGDVCSHHAPALAAAEQRAADLARELEEAREALAKAESEALRYAEMYPPGSDGRNTFVILADGISDLARARSAAGERGEPAGRLALNESDREGEKRDG